MTKRTGGTAREQPCRLLGAWGAQEVTGDWPGTGELRSEWERPGYEHQQGDVARIPSMALTTFFYSRDSMDWPRQKPSDHRLFDIAKPASTCG